MIRFVKPFFCLVVLTLPGKAQESDLRNQSTSSPKENVREFLGLGPAPDVIAAKRGESLYQQNCAACHGETARGAQGPNLLRSTLVLHDEDGQQIGTVIKQGRPQAGMPAFTELKANQTYDISQYIHLQVELAANRGTYRQTYDNIRNRVTGDAEKGKMFFASYCSACHSTTGDLSKIGAKFSTPAALLPRILWPTSPDPVQATVHLKTGQAIAGTIVRKDDFDVTLRDTLGGYHSWPSDEVTVEAPDVLSGHRALLPQYTDADLHDLTAYLVNIK